MNKDEFDAIQAALQAQLDAADLALVEAKVELAYAESRMKDARHEMRGHINYGKHRGWIARAKRAKKVEAHADEAPVAAA